MMCLEHINFQSLQWNMIYSQKMIKKEEAGGNRSDIVSICRELNLNTDKLNIQKLMGNATYRRLCNIVKNDMGRSDLSFRKSLIKELYFLLQITPVIKPELTDHFLAEVEKWYNLNDHKKIDLASNKLNKLLNIVHHSKKESTHSGTAERPKSGVTWNQNVSPFLRPYTAQRAPNAPPAKGLRPESSKFGATSTKVDTNDDICIREFTTNIQEELEISQDFLQKHRTNHPDYEPTYEQLYNILKKVETHSHVDAKEEESFQLPLSKATRYSKSALPRKKELPAKEVNVQSYNHIADPAEEVPQAENEERDSDSNSSEEDEEILYVSENKKDPEPVLRLTKAAPKTADPENEDDNLEKYFHCMQNKLVQALNEDREMALNYVDFARVKTSMKRELNRKSESRRLLSAKHTSVKQYTISHRASEEKENLLDSLRVVDLTKDPLNLLPDHIDPYPTYNKRQFLKKRYEEPVRLFKKLNNTEQVPEKLRATVKRPMTACVRFHSPVRFDPTSGENVKQYNLEVLEEIEKIKMKMGSKCSASTDSLMKALYVDMAPPHSDHPLRWEERNPFYGMASKGKEKKLKKKGRRLKSKAKLQPAK